MLVGLGVVVLVRREDPSVAAGRRADVQVHAARRLQLEAAARQRLHVRLLDRHARVCAHTPHVRRNSSARLTRPPLCHREWPAIQQATTNLLFYWWHPIK